MKYHRRIYIAISFCILAWIVVTYLVLSETYSRTITQNSTNLLKRIVDLETLISKEKTTYNFLLNELKRLEESTRVSGNELQKLQEVFSDAGLWLLENITSIEQTSKFSVPETSVKSTVRKTVLPVLVFSCNRITVTRCLDALLKFRPNLTNVEFPIIVSQDCGHAATANAIRSYSDKGVTHMLQPDQSEPDIPVNERKFKGYFKISRHYGWALQQIFRVHNHSAVIIVEDDLEVAPDFFEYFLSTYSLLTRDPTLWCVSAWNDNGKSSLIDTGHPELLYRSDFFPGLGWMMTKDLWNELEPKWPKSYWDDWMRLPEQRKNRACIRPEVSRTRTFGKVGVSNGMFFDKHLKFIHLNEKPVDFLRMQLDFLLQKTYDNDFIREVYNTPVVSVFAIKNNEINFDGPVRITYHTKDAYKKAAKLLGLMDDFKSGVPRLGYKGIVSFFYNGRRVYLAPNANWKGYDLTWS